MKKKVGLILLAAFIIMAACGAYAAVSDWKLIVRLAGTVESQYAGSGNWYMIWQSRKLKDGDKARTLQDSKAQVRLADNSVVTMGQNTTVEVSQFKMTEQSRFAGVKLITGKVRSKVGRFFGKESKFEVQTPNAVLAARGTDFLAEYGTFGPDAKQPTTRLMVFESQVDLTSKGVTKTVAAGNTAMIDADGIIRINPAGYTFGAVPAGVSKGDGDLYKRDAPEVGDNQVPRDPSSVTGTVTSGDQLPQPIPGIQPPPGDTGTVNVIIHPSHSY